jgi:hypothetical protein
MKRTIFLLSLFLLLLGCTSGSRADGNSNNLLHLLQLNEQSAKAALVHAVTGPSYFIPNTKALKNLPVQERVAVIRSAGQQAKAYLASPEFVNAYNAYRETKKPKPPEEPKDSRQITDQYRENLRNSIGEMEKTKVTLPKDQQAMLDGVIGSMQQQLKELEQPDKTLFPAELDNQLKQSYALQMEEHVKSLTAWEQTYPENTPKPTIKQWLATFLEQSATVDFDAQTTEVRPGMITFVNQVFERKDKQWKLYFRAGKETITAARAFAQEWLAELNQ